MGRRKFITVHIFEIRYWTIPWLEDADGDESGESGGKGVFMEMCCVQ